MFANVKSAFSKSLPSKVASKKEALYRLQSLKFASRTMDCWKATPRMAVTRVYG